MNLVKIGSQVINLDQVTDITVDDDGVLLFFTPHERHFGYESTKHIPENTATAWRFMGHEAIALRDWLKGHTFDITPPARPSPVPAPDDDREVITINLDEDDEDD